MKSHQIHPSAIIEPGAQIASDVCIGPFSHIGSRVTLHPGVKIKSHVVVTGSSEIGDETVVYPFSVDLRRRLLQRSWAWGAYRIW